MADTAQIKIIDLPHLKKYDELIKAWFKAQIVYATEEEVTALFETADDTTDASDDTSGGTTDESAGS